MVETFSNSGLGAVRNVGMVFLLLLLIVILTTVPLRDGAQQQSGGDCAVMEILWTRW